MDMFTILIVAGISCIHISKFIKLCTWSFILCKLHPSLEKKTHHKLWSRDQCLSCLQTCNNLTQNFMDLKQWPFNLFITFEYQESGQGSAGWFAPCAKGWGHSPSYIQLVVGGAGRPKKALCTWWHLGPPSHGLYLSTWQSWASSEHDSQTFSIVFDLQDSVLKKWKQKLRPLTVQPLKLHSITSATFYWSKQVTGQPDFRGSETYSVSWWGFAKNLQPF